MLYSLITLLALSLHVSCVSFSVSSTVYTEGKVPALINGSLITTTALVPSLLRVTSTPIKRAINVIEDLTPAADGHHNTHSNNNHNKHGGWGTHYGHQNHGKKSHHKNHGSKSYGNHDQSKHGGQHEDYSKGNRGNYWDKYGEKEKVIKDKGSGFVKAFTWDREEIDRDKWGDKGGNYENHSKGSKGKEYGMKSSSGRGQEDYGSDMGSSVFSENDIANALANYGMAGYNGLTWGDLHSLSSFK